MFPKEAAKLEEVSGRRGTRQKQRQQGEEGRPAAQPPPRLPMLEAAPACVLELPQEPNEADIWACIRCAAVPRLGSLQTPANRSMLWLQHAHAWKEGVIAGRFFDAPVEHGAARQEMAQYLSEPAPPE